MPARTLRRMAAVLLIVTAGLFAIGVSLEDEGSSEGAETTETRGEGEPGHEESGETVEETAAEGEEAPHDEGGEKVLGVDLESPAAVSAAVVASLLLAAGLWATSRRDVALAVVAVASVFAIFDIAEVFHQLDEANTGLAVLAGSIAAGHTVIAATAGLAASKAS
ncbi:MAG: hypothetical protein ACRD0U_07430 [Acidimicrobiales bacterium]